MYYIYARQEPLFKTTIHVQKLINKQKQTDKKTSEGQGWGIHYSPHSCMVEGKIPEIQSGGRFCF